MTGLVEAGLFHAAESRRDAENAHAESVVDLTGAVAAGRIFAVTVVGEAGDNTMAASLVAGTAEDCGVCGWAILRR